MVKLILGTLLFLGLGLVAGLAFLPDHYRIEREVEIAAAPEVVYATVSDLHTWPDWTVWNLELDPQAVFDFTGGPGEAGAELSWSGPKLKAGALRLTEAEAPTHLAYELDLEQGRHLSGGVLELSANVGGTLVTWTNEGELHGLAKLLGPLLDDLVAPQFERGLVGLKRRLETPAEPAE
jgi:uncharacterized protein YndB with AHSA1/START domain